VQASAACAERQAARIADGAGESDCPVPETAVASEAASCTPDQTIKLAGAESVFGDFAVQLWLLTPGKGS